MWKTFNQPLKQNSWAKSQEISPFWGNPEVQYRVQKNEYLINMILFDSKEMSTLAKNSRAEISPFRLLSI
jgi:hypothetical protein